MVGHVALYAEDGRVIEAKGHESGVTSGRYSDAALASVTWVGRLPSHSVMPRTRSPASEARTPHVAFSEWSPS
jgi:hypothetical protein